MRKEFAVCERSVINELLIHRDSIIPPPLHIKLGLVKQFVIALDTNNACFEYIGITFSVLSSEKTTVGIFDGLPISKLIKD